MKSSNRVYGLPFFKITIPFINEIGEQIGHQHIRATTETPFRTVGTQENPDLYLYFRDIDGDIFECREYKFHGPANEEEMNAPYG